MLTDSMPPFSLRGTGTGPGPAPEVGRPRDGQSSAIRASSAAKDLLDVADCGGPTVGGRSLLNAAAAAALSLLVSLSGEKPCSMFESMSLKKKL